MMKLSLKCYSGRKADERPARFWLEERNIGLKLCSISGSTRERIFYKVRADDGNLYIRRQETSTPEAVWDLVSFRQQERKC
jgi:hypothetical protein